MKLAETQYESPVDEMRAIEAEMITDIAVALARSSQTAATASRA